MSTQAPNLQLPQRQAQASRSARPAGLVLVYVLLLVIVGLQAWLLFKPAAAPPAEAATSQSTTDADAERELAMKLEDRNLPVASANAWGRYLAAATLDAVEEGRIRYRVGKLLQQAERYEQAVAEFYRAEQMLGGQAGDLSQRITVHVRECMTKLGQYSDLSREMADRASTSEDDTSLQGRQVVAEIGDEKITVADFDRMLTEQVEQIIATQVGISQEQAQEIRRQAHAQFTDPQARAQQLQQFVASRVLAEEARQQGLQQSPAFKRQMSEFADRLLATRLMLDEVGRRATVTPQDVERYYRANLEAYAEPTQVRIAHILCDSEETARDVIAEANAGEAFGELAQARSLDEDSKETGGVLEQRVVEAGDYVPGVGRNPELHAAVMAGVVNSVLPKPYQSDKGWHVIKIVDREEGRQLPLDEVRDQVESDVRTERRAEVTQQFLSELFEEKGVRFYPQAFAAGGSGEDEN